MADQVVTRVQSSRRELLDVGLRNSLVNCRERMKQIKIVDELSREIFRILVSEEKRMSFDAAPEPKDKASKPPGLTGSKPQPPALPACIRQPEENQGGAPALRHVDLKLQTALQSEALQKRLLSIHNDARGYVQEQGVNILFVALGFLHWYESDSADEARRAPLILIPVELERTSAQERFRIAFSGEDIGDNLSLAEKLRAEFGVELPSLGDTESLDVDQYYEAVQHAISGHARWFVRPNEITLGFFSFGKFLMYRDLDPANWPEATGPANHDVLTALLSEGFEESPSEYGEEDHIDRVIAPSEVHQIMDADSSQILAILDVNAGRNLVLQGPPGTGKSQTITNIIAECVGNGRKVLFVSEKMAALEVVKRRLDKVGLGDAVLELHSHKTKKKQVLQELDRTLNQGRPHGQQSADDIETLTRLRNRLNTYCEAVNEPIGNTRTTFVNALGHSMRTAIDDPERKRFPTSGMTNWSDADFRAALDQIRVLDRHLAEAGPPDRNPFRGSQVDEYLPAKREHYESILTRAMQATDELLEHGRAMADFMSLPRPDSASGIRQLCEGAGRLLSAPDVRGLRVTSKDWNGRQLDLDRLIGAGRALRAAHCELDERVTDQAWDADLVEIREHFVSKGRKWWRVFSGHFRRARSEMQAYLQEPSAAEAGSVISIIDTILDSQKHRASLEELRTLGTSLFGTQWQDEASNWDGLEEAGAWATAMARSTHDGELPEGLLAFMEGSPDLERLRTRTAAIQKLLAIHEKACAEVENELRLAVPDEHRTAWGLTLERQVAVLRRWAANLDALQQLARFNQLSAALSAGGLGFVLAQAKSWEGKPGALGHLFEHSWYTGLVERAFSEKPALKGFERREHAHALKEFARLDRLLFKHNRLRLIVDHWNRLPNLNDGGQLAVIRREVNKKRGHMPIRHLIERAGQAIQAVKPVFMMGPMSVAKYLSPGSVDFDLVIFDEASQVKPVDAFGAILRGKQTVVVGDNRQLPPTSFFDTQVEGEKDDYDSLGDLESILSLFLARGAPERMLRWHYRSQHESLIAVSNQEFYDNRLVVFPSPGINPRANGLRLRHGPKNYYDRGGKRTNPREAAAIARAVVRHARDFPDLTLGVVAFSKAQRDEIECQLEMLRSQDSACEAFFSSEGTEHFFVRSLENVQGDERDVIFISIGYGRNEQGYMSMSFGPLNRDGGERRLNVLITRARKNMEVFSNFTASDMDMSRSKARGVQALKTFLAYAETGHLQQPYSTDKEPDSPFEEAVIRELVKRGYEVEPQVGTAGFFIDIAVKDPEKRGRYLLGVECDGATYHSSRSARDRDRLRQEVLEGLGWKLHRIWSTAWYKNPEREMDKLALAIDNAREHFASVSTSSSGIRRSSLPVVQREEGSRQARPSAAVRYPPYERCALQIDTGSRELHETSPALLAGYVKQVVDIEFPIHRSEVVRRITDGAGLKRAGARIQQTVSQAIEVAAHSETIEVRGDFLWKPGEEQARVRDRSSLESGQKKLELIAPEEIAQALKCEVSRGFSLPANDAISAAGRALGFQRVTSGASATIESQLKRLVREGAVKQVGDEIAAA